MKTSNKGLLAAALVLLGSLSAYNMTLRAEYARGAYKDPTRNMTTLKFENFSEVDVQAATLLDVQVVAGPYRVQVNNEAAQYVKVSQQGPRLVVGVVFAQDREPLGGRNTLIVSLPKLDRLTAGAGYSVAGKATTEKDGSRGGVQVRGFRQDSLALRQDYSARITLSDNELAYLRAEAGRQPGSTPVLRIEKTNRIQAADLNMQAQSVLELAAGGIVRLGTQLGDSVRATLTAAGLGNLRRR